MPEKCHGYKKINASNMSCLKKNKCLKNVIGEILNLQCIFITNSIAFNNLKEIIVVNSLSFVGNIKFINLTPLIFY